MVNVLKYNKILKLNLIVREGDNEIFGILIQSNVQIFEGYIALKVGLVYT